VFVQRCINCENEFGLDERLYVCSRCGDLLEIERREPLRQSVEELRAVWLERRKSGDVRDRSGVWRFREFLPFGSDDAVVSLGEGNTPLYDAPRSAD
jgi:threonine synthase